MKRLSLAVLLLAGAALPASANEVGGRYEANGTNFDGTTYKGTAEIVITSNTTCAIQWTIAGKTIDGICMDKGDSFAAAYVLNGDVGLLIYRIEGDGTLHGTWTLAGAQGRGTEVLTPAD